MIDTKPVALITGGSRGIGLAVAKGFLADGYRVATISRSHTSQLDTAAASGDAVPLIGDLANLEDIRSCSETIISRFGRVDVLVNNAGTQKHELFTNTDIEAWKYVVDVNLIGLAAVTRMILPTMIKRNYGRIINIVSRSAEDGRALMTAYSASKAGVVSFTHSLAAELRYQNVTNVIINAIIPGVTATAMLAEAGWDMSLAQRPEAIYPYVKQLVESPDGTRSGQVYWEGKIYRMYEKFPEDSPPMSE